VIALEAARALDRAAGAIAVIGFLGLVAIAALIFYDGVARSLGLPRIFGFSDYGEAIYPVVIASCFPAALLRGSHVAVTFLGKGLGRRGALALEAFAALVTLGFFAVMVWQLAGFTAGLGDRETRTGVLPLQPFWVAATAVLALCLPAQGFVAATRLAALFARDADAPGSAALADAREGRA
jgi:TRAP-type C4-dicarboxylate transport system permease small subunit